MYIQPRWRVLTVGDGDLSFSHALTQKWPELQLTASVLDSEQQLREKYQHHAIDALKSAGFNVCFEVDMTKSDSFAGRLPESFDLVIFQFPLVPNAGPRRPGQSWHQGEDSNLANRRLLRDVIVNSAHYLLSPDGARLCYITSKDVKPYCDWHIESLGAGSGLDYIGQWPFNADEFPGYRIRNVDRDKQVKSTSATTYVWSDRVNSSLCSTLKPPTPEHPRYCSLCHLGPVGNEQDWQNHQNSRQHKRRAKYQLNWENYLAREQGLF